MNHPFRSMQWAALLLLAHSAVAQQVQWVTATPNDWVLNPTTPVNVLCARDPDHVYVAKLDHIAYTYAQPMGSVSLTRQVADGTVLWSIDLGDSVQVEAIASDDNGVLVLGGRYFQRLLVDGVSVLGVPAGHSGPGSFLCAWDASGQLLWQQDVSGGSFDNVDVASITTDHLGRFWAALSTFNAAHLVRLDGNGAQVEDRPVLDSKTIGSISFDPWGGLYVSGATDPPSITVNGTSFPIPHDYAFFVARMDPSGAAQWVRSAADITFQRPRVQAGSNGKAYLAGTYAEPLAWGSIAFADPLWSSGLFLAQVDSLGDFLWGVAAPATPGSGQFTLGRGNAIGVDDAGNVLVLGNVNGALDWGNGVVIGSGTITDKSIAVLQFSETGIPVWGLSGGSTFSDVMYDVAVAANGGAHLAGVTSDPFTLGPFTADPVNDRGTVVARVEPALSTGMATVQGTAMGAAALPSCFTDGFRIACSACGGAPAEVLVVDANGRVVERSVRPTEELGRGLAPGAYTALVITAAGSWRVRVVKL